jgi:hypothetical protein
MRAAGYWQNGKSSGFTLIELRDNRGQSNIYLTLIRGPSNRGLFCALLGKVIADKGLKCQLLW